ncbi:MAG: choice-of-anchor D domain-containing protein [Verrucomicrobiales bacterium]|nr:choice-of-anchor D domain-containing protein [Verrucomicrobiales bacterium]MCP5559688.1 choice-of-anchor D domain-containing protein [Verrucomicrobiaceae bacterium]
MFFNRNADYPLAKEVRWYPRYHADGVPEIKTLIADPGGVIIRNILTADGYQDLHAIAFDPETGTYRNGVMSEATQNAESRDLAVFWGYDTMGGDYAPKTATPTSALSDPTIAKLATGYPAPESGNTISNYVVHGRLYETNIGDRSYEFGFLGRNAHVMYPMPLQSVTVFGGNSGGGVWTRPAGRSWELAGVTLLGSGGMLPLDAPFAKKAIDSALAKVTNKSLGEYTQKYSITSTWSQTYELGEKDYNVDTFRLLISADGDYQIETLAVLPSTGLDTVGTLSGTGIGTLYGTKVKSISDDSSGDDGKNFRMRLHLLKGVYTLAVRGAYPTVRGPYELRVTPLLGNATQQVQIKGAGKSVPLQPDRNPTRATVALGNHFGTLTTAAPTKTLSFSILNTGGGVLSLTGSPRVSLSGPHASQFTVATQPSDGVIPARTSKVVSSTAFSIQYHPDSLGNHFCIVTIESDSLVNPSFSFAIRGTAPKTFAEPAGDLTKLVSASLEIPGWGSTETVSTSSLDYGGDIDTFRYVLTQKKLCTFFTTGSTDTYGTLYKLVAPRYTKLATADAGGDGRNFRISKLLDPGTYVIAVSGANADVVGDYEMHALQSAVEATTVVTNAKGIPISDDSTLIDATLNTDFGRIDYRKGYVDRVFTLTNQGFADVSLTGTPRVQIDGAGSAAFKVLKQPTVTVLKPAAKLSFTVRCDPAEPGIYDGLVSLGVSDPNLTDGIYNFAIQATSFGAITPLARATRVAASNRGSYYFYQSDDFQFINSIMVWGVQPNIFGDPGSLANLLEPTPAGVRYNPPPVSVMGGGYRIHVVTTDGDVGGWGAPNGAGLGDGIVPTNDYSVDFPQTTVRSWGTDKVVQVAVGDTHTLAMTETGGVWTWGDQTSGKLGNGVVKPYSSSFSHVRVTPISITRRFAGARIVQIAAGAGHSLALDAEGNVWAWGSNYNGQLGLGSTSSKSVPTKISITRFDNQRVFGVACGAASSYAVTEAGAVWAWGRNDSGAVGDGTLAQRNIPVLVTDPVTGRTHDFGGQSIVQIEAGSDQAFVLTADGSVWTWGEAVAGEVSMSNPYGESQATLNSWTSVSQSPRLLVAGTTDLSARIVQMAARGESVGFWSGDTLLADMSLSHCVFLHGDGSVWGYGANRFGEVGDGTQTSRTTPIEVLAAPAPAIPGTVDESFDPSLSGINFGFVSGPAYGIAVQTDGKIIVGGAFTSVGGVTRNHVARLTESGSLDAGFDPNADDLVTCAGVQTDGKLLIGGRFTVVGGSAAPYISRLNANGTVDKTFHGSADGTVYCVLPQANGKVLVGGQFSSVGGTGSNRVARLNIDGTPDYGFVSGLASTFSNISTVVKSIALQADDKIVIGGSFASVGGTACSSVARLNANGSLDPSFFVNASSYSNIPYINCVVIQPDGKILIGGVFNTIIGIPRNCIARLNPDGSLDDSFDPNVSGFSIYGITPQSDGKIIVVGDFASVSGTTRRNIARLNADGSVDPTFVLTPSDSVLSGAIQGDGRAIIGGGFTMLDSTSRNFLGRLLNDPAEASLITLGNNRVRWLRSGASPEVTRVTFDMSINGGKTWTSLGAGRLVIGGWELDGLRLPTRGKVRARGQTTGGFNNGSSGMVEATTLFFN